MTKILSLLMLVSMTSCYSQGLPKKKAPAAPGSEDKSVLGSLIPGRASYSQELILGNILKSALEGMHLNKKKADDDLSMRAFDQLIEKLDYGKQFLLKSDVQSLKKYKYNLDDALISGDLKIIDEAKATLMKRIKQVQLYVDQILKKPFDYTKKDTLETDSEKRRFVTSLEKLNDLWRRLLKYETLVKIEQIREEQEGKKDDKKKKKKKKKSPIKKIAKKDYESEARKKVLKSYHRIFTRLLKNRKSDRHDDFYNSLTRIYDPHTHYMVPEEKEDFDIDMSGKLEGIGALLREEGSYIKVERIIPGSASWKGKMLEAEDTILKVGQEEKDPVDIVDMGIRDAVKLIRGKKGTTVKLTVKKPDGSIKVIPIVRDEVILKASYVNHKIVEHTKLGLKIGYIYVPKFYRDFQNRNGRNCSDDVKNALIALKKKNVQGMILDLRDNGGGALEDAKLMSGLFIDKGPIVQVKGHNGQIDQLTDTDGKTYYDGPLVVMINRFSASASEIVAAALQDYDRAVVVGTEHSHGKGTVQAVLDLDNFVSKSVTKMSSLGSLKLTIQMFYRITGGSTQYKGVNPDIVFPDRFSYLESGEKFLDYSIPWNKVPQVKFDKWKKKANLSSLKSKSQSRVSKNKRMQQYATRSEWFKKRKENSIKSLVKKDFQDDQKLVKDMSEKFKNEETIPDLKVIPLEDMKKKTEAEREEFEEFAEKRLKDPYLEETMYIFKDLLGSK